MDTNLIFMEYISSKNKQHVDEHKFYSYYKESYEALLTLLMNHELLTSKSNTLFGNRLFIHFISAPKDKETLSLQKEHTEPPSSLDTLSKMVSPPNFQERLHSLGNNAEKVNCFIEHDQFTLYFNQFSSLGAILRLADDVNNFLLKTDYMAPSDGYEHIITINPFFSARIDVIHSNYGPPYHYGYLKFFDRECSRFIDAYKDELKATEELPIGGFEIMLLICLAIPGISDSKAQELNEEHSKIVQGFFKKMKDNTKEFILQVSQIIKGLKENHQTSESVSIPLQLINLNSNILEKT